MKTRYAFLCSFLFIDCATFAPSLSLSLFLSLARYGARNKYASSSFASIVGDELTSHDGNYRRAGQDATQIRRVSARRRGDRRDKRDRERDRRRQKSTNLLAISATSKAQRELVEGTNRRTIEAIEAIEAIDGKNNSPPPSLEPPNDDVRRVREGYSRNYQTPVDAGIGIVLRAT